MTDLQFNYKMDKERAYKELEQQAESLFADETNVLANMSNFCALVHRHFLFWWTGFYLVEANQLVLGPFQGPVACTRIDFGKGVCGTAWKTKEIQIVPNVHEFEGHIACSSVSNSEIVIPIEQNGQFVGVLDIDSEKYNTFDQTDAVYLHKMLKLIWK
ncbi:MAG: GAF domain-containing protein [Flavobacteriales bacterium]|nr:GAF domain-containing protein [Flavobacteriales bacterium]